MRVKQVFFCFLLFMLPACGIKIPVIMPQGSPVGDDVLSNFKKSLELRQNSVRSFKALYYTTIERAERRERLRQLFLFEQPDKLRFELLPTTSTYSLGLLIAVGGKAQYVNPESGEITNSDSVEDLILENLRFRAGTREVADILLGMIEPNIELYNLPDGKLHAFSREGHFNASISKEGHLPLVSQFLDKESGRVSMVVEYSDYKLYKGIMAPSVIKIFFVRDEVVATLKANHFDLNVEIPKKMFDLFEDGS